MRVTSGPGSRRTAITRLPDACLSLCELTFLDRQPISALKALRQHQSYRHCLEALGLDVRVLPALPGFPDSVFVEDTALVLPEVAIAMPMGVGSRRPETETVVPVLEAFRDVTPLPDGCRMDGGDVLHAGRRLYVGLSSRSDPGSARALAAVVGRWGYEVRVVLVHSCLHLKTACSALLDNTFLANVAWIDADALGARRVLRVPDGEPWAANVLRVDDSIVVPRAHRKTAALLRAEGYDVHAVDVSEFAKAEAGVTCLSILIDAASVPAAGATRQSVQES
jgi:dimethylargininase